MKRSFSSLAAAAAAESIRAERGSLRARLSASFLSAGRDALRATFACIVGGCSRRDRIRSILETVSLAAAASIRLVAAPETFARNTSDGSEDDANGSSSLDGFADVLESDAIFALALERCSVALEDTEVRWESRDAAAERAGLAAAPAGA